jgi:selenocysteine lyase/cysteine desulfurase
VGCVEFLARNSVAVRSIPGSGAIRVSCGFFTTAEEIDLLFSLVEVFRQRSAA